MSTFSTLVKDERKRRKLSYFSLALIADVNPTTIWSLEKTGQCTLRNASRVAKALGITEIPID